MPMLTIHKMARTILLSLSAGLACGGTAATVSDAGAQDGGGQDAPATDTSTPDGGCGDTMTDPHNCGVCGKDCLGGTCTSGKCDVVRISDSESGLSSIAADSTGAYWAVMGKWSLNYADGAIRHVDTKSTAATTVLTTTKAPYSVVTDGTKVYFSLMGSFNGSLFTGDGTVVECPAAVNCSSPVVLGNTGSARTPVAFNSTDVFWFNQNTQQSGVMMRYPKSGGSATQLSQSGTTFLGNIVATDTRLYMLSNGTLVQYVLPGGGSVLIENEPNNMLGTAMASDSKAFYFTAHDLSGSAGSELSACSLPGCSGGSVPLVTRADKGLTGVALSGETVFWTDMGTIYSCTISSCSTTTAVLVPPVAGIGDILGLAIYQGVLYWAWNDAVPVGHVARLVF